MARRTAGKESSRMQVRERGENDSTPPQIDGYSLIVLVRKSAKGEVLMKTVLLEECEFMSLPGLTDKRPTWTHMSFILHSRGTPFSF